jgi:hypothetical protein
MCEEIPARTKLFVQPSHVWLVAAQRSTRRAKSRPPLFMDLGAKPRNHWGSNDRGGSQNGHSNLLRRWLEGFHRGLFFRNLTDI